MRRRVAHIPATVLAIALVALALVAGGCGSGDDSNTGNETATESQKPPDEGFPFGDTTSTPDVTTTPGAPQAQSPGKAGGGSGTTCIGC